jgi:peptidoglycan hydrolase CwlO-like protein
MAEVDYLTIILPTVIASIVTFVVLGIKKLGSTSEGALSGSIKLENVQNNVQNLETKMDKGFEKIEHILNEKDKEDRMVFDKIWGRVEELNSDMNLHEYRLNQLDRRRGMTGGDKSAI